MQHSDIFLRPLSDSEMERDPSNEFKAAPPENSKPSTSPHKVDIVAPEDYQLGSTPCIASWGPY